MHRPARTLPPEVLTPEEVGSLFEACGGSWVGARDRALLAVMYRAGLRVSEALALEPKDIDLERGAVRVLRGKGGRARTVMIAAFGTSAIAADLDGDGVVTAADVSALVRNWGVVTP